MKMINWNALSKRDYEKIEQLSCYFEKLCLDQGLTGFAGAKRDQLFMDLVAVHTGGCPLRLDDMLRDLSEGRKADLGHDLSGIWNHFNRQTLEFDTPFWPRYAR